MLHINVFNVFIARPTQKTKTTPNPSPRASAASIAAHSVCGPSLVQSIKRYQQPVTKSAVHPAGPVHPYQHWSLLPPTFYSLFTHISLESWWHKTFEVLATQLQLQLEGLQGLVFLASFPCTPCTPLAISIIANRMQMSWTAKLNSKWQGERERQRESERDRRIKLA